MPGKLYKNDVRLSKAFSEGFNAPDGATNPHPDETPAGQAWVAGYNQNCPGQPDYYGGEALHTGNWWCGPNGPVQNP